MDDYTESLIDDLRKRIELSELDDRKAIVDSLLIGYCRDCLTETHGRHCHCENDE